MWVSLQGIGSKGDTKIFGNNFQLQSITECLSKKIHY